MRRDDTRNTDSVERAFADWLAAAIERLGPRGAAERALGDARYRPDVVERDRNQPEFLTPVGVYLAKTVSDRRVSRGRGARTEHGDLLLEIEEEFGVPPEIQLAIWGVETAFGETRGDIPVVDALATLAFDGRRGAFFERELRAALDILAAGDIAADAMNGSWAGAMGHTQFMPSSFLRHAVDFDGDGRRDIWNDDPADALASTAAYLAGNGWLAGESWGGEVVLPENLRHGLAEDDISIASEGFPSALMESLIEERILLPAGTRGPAFMTGNNFRTLKTYNPADAYALAVGHLADRIAGGGPIQVPWPPGDEPPTREEVRELQIELTEAGFPTDGADGIIGPNTRRALRSWQASTGRVPDGHVRTALTSMRLERAAIRPPRR